MVKRNLIANYIGSCWSALMGIAFLPIYIKYLGIEAYALIGVFASLQAWFVLLDMGLSQTLNREMARFTAGVHTAQSIRNLLKTMEMVYLVVAILLAISLTVFSSWIAGDWLKVQTLSIETVTRALAIMGLIISFRWMGTLYRSAIFGLQHQVWLNSATAIFSTLRGLGSIAVLAYVSPTIQAFFMFQGAVAAIETAALAWKTRKFLPAPPETPRFSMNALKDIWRFAAGMTTLALLNTLLTQVDKLLLSTLLPLKDFGYFTLATTVAGAISMLSSPIVNVATPRFAELVAIKDENTLAEQYHKFAQLLAIAVIPASLVLYFFSGQIMFLWTRDFSMIQTVAPIISVWVIGTGLNSIMFVPYLAQLAYGWTRLEIITNSIAVVVIIPAFLILVPRYGVMAAAWIWVATNAGYMLFTISAMHLRILKQEKWKWYRADVFWPLLAGLPIAGAMLALTATYTGKNRMAEIGLLAIGAFFVIVATAMATKLGRQFIWQVKYTLTNIIYRPKIYKTKTVGEPHERADGN